MNLQRQSSRPSLQTSQTSAKSPTTSNVGSDKKSKSFPPSAPAKYPTTSNNGSSSAPSVQLAAVPMPKSGGAISSIGEKFSTDPSTGTAKLIVPITTTSIDTRGSASPSLNLSYNSGSGNGIFGYGWTLSLGEIARKTALGLPKYFDTINNPLPVEQDTFILSGFDDLIPELEYSINGDWTPLQPNQRTLNSVSYFVHQYRPRVEVAFQRIERWISTDGQNSHWRTISSDNVISIYGYSKNSQIADPADGTRIFSWLLSEVRDDRGGRYIIQYKPEDSTGVDTKQSNESNRTSQSRSANRYPKHIYYGNSVSTLSSSFNTDDKEWLFQIVFDYGEHDKAAPTPTDTGNWLVRNDAFSSYTSGFEIRTYRLCQRVLMFHNFPNESEVGSDCLVKSTNFVYTDVRGTSDLSNLGNKLGTFLTSVSPISYRRNGNTYSSAAFPPIEFKFSFATIDSTIHGFDPESEENLPYGIDDKIFKFVDLDGEGIAGVLSETSDSGALMYKSPLGSGKFGSVQTLPFKPNSSIINENRKLIDLERDGSLDVVILDSFDDGFSRRTWENFHPKWLPFKKFSFIPNIDWKDENLRFIDLTGDGLSDILITQDEVFTWYQSLGEYGFGEATRLFNKVNDEEGPHLIFADALHRIFLADMSGDGLMDIVRIRYGEANYWPNTGYGQFGKKISMDNAPWPDHPDAWDPAKVILADIDGNGLTDMIYLGQGKVSIFFNQSGNAWSNEQQLPCAPITDNWKYVQAVDLFGNGTICLLWSSSLSTNQQTMQYIDLMTGVKPNLLTSYTNNIGTEVKLHYASSTKFYLKDKVAGTPWITRIPFPVQVVEKYETLDHVGRTFHSCHYEYHHGYYDGVEREFRGFGMVEQFDTEHFDILDKQATDFSINIDPKSNIPPVWTKTWFSTGLWMGDGQISTYFRGEYWKEPGGLSDQEQIKMQITDTQLPTAVISRDGISHPYAMNSFEAMEACRALHGKVLRQEIFALDDSVYQSLPYSVSENNFLLNLLQPRGIWNQRCVFMLREHESIHFSYERYTETSPAGLTLCSPKVLHTMNLIYDAFGNVLQTATIAYGQRFPDADPHHFFTPTDLQKQSTPILTYDEYDYTNPINQPDAWRIPLNCENRSYELRKATNANGYPLITNLLSVNDLLQSIQQASDGGHDLPFGDWQGQGAAADASYRRLFKRVRILFQKDDLSAPLPVGKIESRAIVFQMYNMGFTQKLLQETFIDSGRISSPTEMGNDMMEGGYLNLDGDNNWWIPSGRYFYSPTPSDTPVQELQYAMQNFFLPLRYRDPFYTASFDTEKFVTYDTYRLLPQETIDARGNRISAGQRDKNPTNPLAVKGLDYRLMTITLIMDPNQNMTAFAFDILGMLVGTAIMGKPDQNAGDSLVGFSADLTNAGIADYFASPVAQAPNLLAKASTRWIYDIWAYNRTKSQQNPIPCAAAKLSRETHVSDLTTGQESRILQAVGYSDGLGRKVQSKILTEPGPVPQRDSTGSIIIAPNGQPLMTSTPTDPRWVGSGWVVYNNKQLPVRQYEPFFTDLFAFEFNAQIGISPTMFYDPVGRNVAILHPDHTWDKFLFKPWYSESWDQNDTVLISDPKSDTDVGDFFARLPDTDYLPTWYQARNGGLLGTDEQTCAQNTAVHANTPSISHTDPLGRVFLSVVNNSFKYGDAAPSDPFTEQFYVTRTDLDVQNNIRQIFDSKGRQVVKNAFNMISQVISHQTMDSGQRWAIMNAMKQQLYAFDDRGFIFHHVYDELQRKSNIYLRQGTGKVILYEKISYGDSKTVVAPEVNNVRLQVIESRDQAGIITTDLYDFKGNLLNKTRALAQNYRETLDWTNTVPTESITLTTLTTYNALGLPTATTLPDKTAVHIGYDLESRTQTTSANMQGSTSTTSFVLNIAYIANGQRESVNYGNGVSTSYEYDWFTKRLSHLITRRNAQKFPSDCPQPSIPSWPGCQIQSLFYTNDPVGNTTNIRDDAQQTIFFRNVRVEPSNYFIFDSTYHLIEAGGREHLGQTQGVPNAPSSPGSSNDFGGGLANPNDGNAMVKYIERYYYDSERNITSLKHLGSDPVNPGWTRIYNYADYSELEPTVFNNRLSSTTIGTTTENYGYDSDAGLHGNMTSMPNLPIMNWDARDQLHASSKQIVTDGGTPEMTYYVYDDTGQRVRKATETYAAPGATPSRKSQTIYISGYEVYSRFETDGITTTLVRDSVHILDGLTTVAIVENQSNGGISSSELMRYQLCNHLGSVTLELDDTAAIISYEEYTPYGSSSYFAVGSQIEAPKRYRYTGKERDDEETGLYYFGARYYAHWLGKWISSDPAGFVDGLNPFVYAKSNPIKLVDTTGMDSGTPKDFQLKMPGPARTPGLGPTIGSNIHLMAPLPVPPADLSSSSTNFSAPPSPPGINLNLPSPLPPSSGGPQHLGQPIVPKAPPSLLKGFSDLKLHFGNVGTLGLSGQLDLKLHQSQRIGIFGTIEASGKVTIKVDQPRRIGISVYGQPSLSSTSSSGPVSGGTVGFDIYSMQKIRTSGTPAEQHAAALKVSAASDSFSQPLPTNLAPPDLIIPVAKAASSIANYVNTATANKKSSWDLRVEVTENNTPVTAASIQNNRTIYHELTLGKGGLGQWSGNITATVHW